MKNLFDAKNEKITEKAFSQGLIISILSILLCIVALCSVTYAWFIGETSSGDNTLVSGSFEIVSAVSTSTSVVSGTNGKYILEAPDKYLVTITPDNATAKGYCVIKIDGVEYRTNVIVTSDTKDEIYSTVTSPFTFTIDTTKANTIVEIEAHWGIPADPMIDNLEVIKIGTASTETASIETESTETASTETESMEAETTDTESVDISE